jgi:hypothetical protein
MRRVKSTQLLSVIAETLFHDLTVYFYLNCGLNEEFFKPRFTNTRGAIEKQKRSHCIRQFGLNTDPAALFY